MSGPGEGGMVSVQTNHHFFDSIIPSDFARVIQAAATKAQVSFEEQFLKWAQMGAECSRLHQPKVFKSGRKK